MPSVPATRQASRRLSLRRRDLLGASLLVPSVLAAQDHDEEGFVPLFDGQTLAGWQIREGPESSFFVKDGTIVVHYSSNYPTWLSTTREYENFDLRGEFYLKGWIDSGIYLHAPLHGPPPYCGVKIHLFHKRDPQPNTESMGSIFPLVAPLRADAHQPEGWNRFQIHMDWPQLRVWINNTLVQNCDLHAHPELRHRLRRGFLGLESLSYPIRFRRLRIRELPAKESWTWLYRSPSDIRHWRVSQGDATWETLGEILRSDGLGYLSTTQQYQDFEFQAYVRAAKHSNAGIYFRSDADPRSARHNEIQIHDVEMAAYPTGSLYGLQRSRYPRIQPEQWFLLQIVVQGPHCLVRINGETVTEFHSLTNTAPGYIQLQAHERNKWTEYKRIRIRAL